MGTASTPPGKAAYVAPRPDWDWLRIEQRKLYARSEQQVDYVFCKLWGLVTDPRNLRMALARVAGNRGRRTAGGDGITVGHVTKRVEDFIAALRSELRSGTYRPQPVRRVLIPKIGAPGKFRPLGIPTVKDRVVQAALKNILEPVFEADFFPVSFGFRPGKSVHGGRWSTSGCCCVPRATSKVGSHGFHISGSWRETSRDASTTSTTMA